MTPAEAMMFGAGVSDRLGQTRRQRNQETLMSLVGGLASKGDYGGAASELMRAGQIEPGMAMQQIGQQQTQMDQARAREAGVAALSAYRQLRAMPEADRYYMAPAMATRLGEYGVDVSNLRFDDLSDARIDQEMAILGQLEAPEYGMEDGVPFERRGSDVTWGPPRPRTEAEQADDALGVSRLAFDQNKFATEQARAGVPDASEAMSTQTSLRKEYGRSIAPYADVLDSYARLVEAFNAGQEGSSIGDQVISTMLAKMADPGSVVRPSEAEAVQEAQSLFQQWQIAPERFFDGSGRLHQEFRTQILTLAQQWAQAAERGIETRQTEFQPIIDDALRRGFDINADTIFQLGTTSFASPTLATPPKDGAQSNLQEGEDGRLYYVPGAGP